MHCPKCAKEDPPQARFCPHCGAKLSLVCPQGQTELPSDAQFCLACGAPVTVPGAQGLTAAELLKRHAPREHVERLLATRGQVHDERRTVTILFADVKGSTAMEEKLDPEDVKEVMHGAFEVPIRAICHYEATPVQLLGGAMAGFWRAYYLRGRPRMRLPCGGSSGQSACSRWRRSPLSLAMQALPISQ